MNEALYRRLIARLSPVAAAAFQKAVRELANAPDVRALEAGIRARDFDAVSRALRLPPAALDRLSEELRFIFREGGTAQMGAVGRSSGGLFQAFFAMGNPRAERAARSISSRLISEVLDDTRRGVRLRIGDGINRGENPRATARNIVGRAKDGFRGGIIGLHSRQVDATIKMHRELNNLDASYFKRKLRNRRYDAIVKRHIEAGKPIPGTLRTKILQAYGKRLRIHRGQVIARTETIASLNAGRYEAMQQVIDEGVDADLVSGEWSATMDARTRDTHQAMNGQRQPWGQPFVSPSGALMLYPGDVSLGASGAEVISCRCHAIWRVDWATWATRDET